MRRSHRLTAEVKVGLKGHQNEVEPLRIPRLQQYFISYISFSQEYLMGNPENLLKGKTGIEKLWLTLKYIPMFSLTAFFRVGTGVPKVGSCKCRRTNHCLMLGDGPILRLYHPILSNLLLLHCLDLVKSQRDHLDHHFINININIFITSIKGVS